MRRNSQPVSANREDPAISNRIVQNEIRDSFKLPVIYDLPNLTCHGKVVVCPL